MALRDLQRTLLSRSGRHQVGKGRHNLQSSQLEHFFVSGYVTRNIPNAFKLPMIQSSELMLIYACVVDP